MDGTTILVGGTIAVPSILMMGWVRILNSFDSWRLLFAASVVVVAIAGWLLSHGRLATPEAIALAAPLYHLLLFRAAYSLFLRRMGREPENVSLVWTRGLAADRIFAFSYPMVSVFSVFAVIGHLIWATQHA